MINDHRTLFLEGDPKAWKQTLDLNVYGLALCSHFAIKQMREYKIDGHIVNISSVVGHQVIKMPLPTFNMYAPSKFAVTALEKVLEQELAYYGTKIKVSVSKISSPSFDSTISEQYFCSSFYFFPVIFHFLHPRPFIKLYFLTKTSHFLPFSS